MVTNFGSIFWGFFIVFFIFALISGFWIWKTENRLKRFFLGKKGQDMESKITELEEKLSILQSEKENLKKEIFVINTKLRKSIRGVETIRFNPFPDQGSNQSFAIGVLNEDGDGVVLSSLYSRERMSMFAKPIKNNSSQYELTEEERAVLEKAKVK